MGESNKRRSVEEDIQPMVLQMEQQMFAIRQKITSYDENSGEATQSMFFQGSTMFTPIITTLLVVEIHTIDLETQSQPTILKHRKKIVVKNLTTKKPRTTQAIHIVYLIDKVRKSISVSPIVEEIPHNSSVVAPLSQEPSLHTASNSTTLSETIPSNTRITTKEMEVDLTQ